MTTYFRNQGIRPAEKISLAGFQSAPKVFLAEGDAEAFFLEAVFRHHDYPRHEYAVFCYGGNKFLDIALKTLQGDKLFPDVTALGIMTDADNNPDGRKNSVLNHCRNINYIGPRTRLGTSGIASFGGRKLGLFVSPGGGKKGRIEDLVKKEIANNPEHPCIEAFSDCLNGVTGDSLSEKAVAQVFITSRNDTLCGVGRAFEARILDINDPAYAKAAQIFTSI